MTRGTFRKNALSLLAIMAPGLMWGQEATAKAVDSGSSFELELNAVLAIIMVVLLLPLYLSGQSFLLATKKYIDSGMSKLHASKELSVILLLLFASQLATAQTSASVAAEASQFNGYTWLLLGAIALEILVMAFFAKQTITFLKPPAAVVVAKQVSTKHSFQDFWERINRFRPLEEEADMDTGHDYDGIKELDNITPPWFLAGFALSILFAIVYLWRYHVSESAPLQIEEYKIEMAKAEIEEAERLSLQANKVDENNVVLLDATGIEQGKKIFVEKCAACHAEHGGSMPGGVGPNLTDDHWLHGGSLKDIFKSIKYGWPDKGMISWKDQLSPTQIAQAASFIKSVKGSTPPGAKEPQGDLYEEVTATETVQDSSTINQ